MGALKYKKRTTHLHRALLVESIGQGQRINTSPQEEDPELWSQHSGNSSKCPKWQTRPSPCVSHSVTRLMKKNVAGPTTATHQSVLSWFIYLSETCPIRKRPTQTSRFGWQSSNTPHSVHTTVALRTFDRSPFDTLKINICTLFFTCVLAFVSFRQKACTAIITDTNLHWTSRCAVAIAMEIWITA